MHDSQSRQEAKIVQLTGISDRTKVHVDAKIINRDSTNRKIQRTFVAYVVVDGKEDGSDYDEVTAEDACETDAAELYAIDFAMRKLGEGHFVLLCDNESVVKVLNGTEEQFRRKHREITKKVWQSLRDSDGRFEVEHFPLNMADRFLNEKWLEIKNNQASVED